MIEISIFVPTVSCDHCKGAVEGAVAQLDGVESVTVDVAPQRVAVRFDNALVDRGSIIAAIGEAGYEVPEPAPPASSGGGCLSI